MPNLARALMGVSLMLFGTLITVAIWHGAVVREHSPSHATEWPFGC